MGRMGLTGRISVQAESNGEFCVLVGGLTFRWDPGVDPEGKGGFMPFSNLL